MILELAGINRPLRASNLSDVCRELSRTFPDGTSSYLSVAEMTRQRSDGRFEEEKPKMMVLWSSFIREQKCAGHFAGQPANKLPLRHLRL